MSPADLTILTAIASAAVASAATLVAARRAEAQLDENVDCCPRTPERAVIYIAGVEDKLRSETCCLAHCERRGYEIVALIHDDSSGKLRTSLWPMFYNGEAEVLVVCSRSRLAPDRVPRVEYTGRGRAHL